MQEELENNGFCVLRGTLTEEEVDRLSGPIRTAFENGDYDAYQPNLAYPKPGVYSMGPRVLDKHPDIAALSLAHPAIVNAIETFFGEPISLGQYWSIMRPPGAGVGDKTFVKGSGAHYDYKPWRCVGSYVKWMFAVIPFVDYTETAGPLVISPGSHLKTTVLPSNGRVHQVDAARVPAPGEITLIDPELKKGDVVLMHGFSWHEARPNYGNSDRCGLYMKFYARSAPPACGPIIYPSAVHEFLPSDKKYLTPQHRADGRYAAVRETPVGGIDEAQIIVEDSEGSILVLGNDTDGWRLPWFAAAEDDSSRILDVCNVIGSVQSQAQEQLGLHLPWLSWLQDIAGQNEEGTGETRCRVYGHLLPNASPPIRTGADESVLHCWMSADDLQRADTDGLLKAGAQVRKWLHMWQQQEDENGHAVTRGYGVPTTDVQYFSYNGNGNPPGTYRIGEFGPDGKPKLDSADAA